jgi:hypothetical protein
LKTWFKSLQPVAKPTRYAESFATTSSFSPDGISAGFDISLKGPLKNDSTPDIDFSFLNGFFPVFPFGLGRGRFIRDAS